MCGALSKGLPPASTLFSSRVFKLVSDSQREA